MRLSKLSLISIFLLISLSNGYSQFYKRFNIEIGVNRSKIINTKQLFTDQTNNAIGSSQANLRSESSSYTNNYSMSLGYLITKGHNVRIRYSYNTLGSHITGKFSSNIFCGVGAFIYDLRNAHNRIENVSLGGMYEFQVPIAGGGLSLGIGIEKQWNDFEDAIIVFQGMLLDNYALHSSIGYIAPLFDFVHLHPKLFITKSINKYQESYHYGYSGDYLPLQIGIEIGLRIHFKKI